MAELTTTTINMAIRFEHSSTQFAVVLLVAVALASAEPKADAKPGVLAYSAPLVAATSSQAIVRNYNGLSYPAYSPYSPYSPYSAPLIAAPAAAVPFAYSAYTASPYAYAAAPFGVAPLPYSAPVVL